VATGYIGYFEYAEIRSRSALSTEITSYKLPSTNPNVFGCPLLVKVLGSVDHLVRTCASLSDACRWRW
jgi:hypothetical protein